MNAPPEQLDPQKERRWRWFGWITILVLLVGAFFAPQEVPLEWYPLNEPGTDINYLEIKCASDKDGWVQIFYDATHGFNDLDSIRFPISPTKETYTYTFPLLDAPMIALRLDPVAKGGTLNIHHIRIINRRGEEIRRFSSDSFVSIRQIAAIRPLPTPETGWTITSTPDSDVPQADIVPFIPTTPVGINHRNLLRCLLSTGYLAGMLWILMMAVVTAFWRPSSWRNFLSTVSTVAVLAIPLSAVGNRGLIRNSIHYAHYVPPDPAKEFYLECAVKSTHPTAGQIYWDSGTGMSEAQSLRCSYALNTDRQVLRFRLPPAPIKSLRFDPEDEDGTVEISAVRIINGLRQTLAELPPGSLKPAHNLTSTPVDHGVLTVVAAPGVSDPYLMFTDASVAEIDQVISHKSP